MRIAISGLSGCGNTTVSNLVADKLGYENINYTFRNLSVEKGVSFADICRMAKSDDKFDFELDAKQVSIAMEHENCVLASRLSIWMLKDADFKCYIDVSLDERSRRICKREGGTFEDKKRETSERDAFDTSRYKRLYDIDNTKPEGVADMIISGDDLSAEQIAEMIVCKVRQGASACR